MNDTPSSERMHIGFFGLRNAGKSSLVNAVTGQEMAIVSEVRGTTTDPVYKSMELLPMGPVVIIDTPGMDDTGALGEMRVRKTRQILNRTDVAVLVTDATRALCEEERELLNIFCEKRIPYVIARNKCDLLADTAAGDSNSNGAIVCLVSALTGEGIHELKETIAHIGSNNESEPKRLVADLVNPLDVVVLVVPIDESAPKGRLILPQQQVIRDLLEAGAVSVVVRETELRDAFDRLAEPPALVITDSQAFQVVAQDTPESVPLTSFSILMARYKGFLDAAVRGAKAIDTLKPGDRVLISEGCTHHRQCQDIGTVKLPRLLRKHLGFDVEFDTSSGREFPEDLSPYRLVIHCGACMLNQREVLYRMKCAEDQGIPFTNYGISIAHMRGILARSIAMLPGFGEER
jgi:[FeFe] hydrogenase H-cluster maturation GTPase HydF